MTADQEEVRFEQAYVDWLFEEIERRKHTQLEMLQIIDREGAPRGVRERVHKELERLRDVPDKIVHGRLDMESEETFYIGRLSLDSDGRAPLVNYEADFAAVFYQASRAEPLEVGRRRTIKMRGRRVVSIEDEYLIADFKPPERTIDVPAPPPGLTPTVEPEIFTTEPEPGREPPSAPSEEPMPGPPPVETDGPASTATAADERSSIEDEVRAPDTLLEDLGRARSGAMGEIVATIQADQDRLIRADPGRVLIVQGGPGTGKTIVALHRVAWVLYKARKLGREPTALVIGPNERFVEYIKDVLPALGEGGVLQTSLNAIAASRLSDADRERTKPVRSDDARVAKLKGDARMADVVLRSVWLNVRPESISLPWRRFRLELGTEDVAELVEELFRRGGRYADLRQDLAEAMARKLGARLAARQGLTVDTRDLADAVRRHLRESGVLNRIVPTVSARRAVRQLFTDVEHLRASTTELRRPERETLVATVATNGRYVWSEHDGPLLDEAAAVIDGQPTRFTHVVVDEAQDLSPMQWRMVRRRAVGESMTVTGDLAQATSEWGADDWDSIAERAGVAADALYAELKLGYRVPEPIMQFAGRLLPSAAPMVDLPRSFRRGPEPQIHSTTSRELVGQVVRVAESLRTDGGDESVAVIVPPELEAQVALALAQADVDVIVVGDAVAKGLEFDRTVVAAPDLIARGGKAGLRRLYICLTRSTKQLAVVHSRALPQPLRGPAPIRDVRARIRETRLAKFAEVMAPRQAQLKVFSNAYAKWTPAEEDDLRRRVQEGLAVDEIAELHGRSPRSVRSRIRKLDLTTESRG